MGDSAGEEPVVGDLAVAGWVKEETVERMMLFQGARAPWHEYQRHVADVRAAGAQAARHPCGG